MSAVIDFIHSQKDTHREILKFIHDLMLSYNGVTSKIRYRIPFYYKNSWICYANPKENEKVELVFLRANEFKDYTGLLDTKGRKQVAGITIGCLEEIPDDLADVINESLRIDAEVRYKSKRVG